MLPAQHRVYAIGDIHGRLDCLLDLQAKITFDQIHNPTSYITEIYLGDYTDRGPQSREVIENLIARRLNRGAICLAGNHDLVLKTLLDDPFGRTSFHHIGGAATVRSYGISDPKGTRPTPLLIESFAEAMPQTHKNFLASISKTTLLQIGDIVFVHAGIRPGVPFADQEIADLVWIRDEFSGSEAWHGALIVHGHTLMPAPLVLPNRINVDTGAYRSGRLTCVVLEAEGLRFLEGKGPVDLSYRSKV